jgi:hypothetical protein
LTECEKFYFKTETEIEIILAEVPFLRQESQRWKSKDLIISWDIDHLEQYIFSGYSPHIELLTDPKKISQRVLSLFLLYNGSGYIRRLNLNSKVRATAIYGKEFHEKVWASEIEEYPFEHNEDFYEKDCFKYEDTPLDTVLFELAKIDQVVRTILFLAGLITPTNSFEDSILSWGTLYKIYDTVDYGCKESVININSLIPKAKLKAFTATCNNMSILGLNSRHGLKKYGSPPTNIITELEEAVYIILCLSKNFLTEYIKSVHGISYKGNKCKVENYSGRVFSHFSKADYEEFRKADWSEMFKDFQ